MQEINQSVHGYLRIFFRRKWLLVIPAFAGLILGICTAVVLPRQWASRTTILVQEGKSDNPLFNNIAVSSTMGQRTQAIRETILGWESLVKLVKRLNLDSKVKSNVDFERLVMGLRRDIIINLRQGNIIDLTYVTDDPRKAQAVVQNVTDIFIERNVSVQNRETEDAIKFIEDQLNVYRGKIKSAEIAEIKDRLAALLIDSTEEHPLVKQLRNDIEKKMEMLKKDNLQYSDDARLNAETTNGMIAEIKKSLDLVNDQEDAEGGEKPAVADKDLYKVILLDKLDNVMARDVGVNDNLYNVLLQRLETAKMTQRLQSSKEGTRYTILDPARLPLVPMSPNVTLVVLMGLFLGLGIGGGLLFLTEFLDKSFLDVQEASTHLGVPLLGAVSRINTQESLFEEKEKTKWTLFWMVAAGMLLIAFTVMIHAFMKP